MIYLASPYTAASPTFNQMEERFLAAQSATAWLIQKRIWTYSPIVHCHEMAKAHRLPKEFEFWKDYNFAFLRRANTLMILKIGGWNMSAGVAAETSEAIRLGLPIFFLVPTGNDSVIEPYEIATYK